MIEIKSSQNQKYKYIKSLLQKKERTKNGEYTVEGIKSVGDAVKAGAEISCIAVSADFDAKIEVGDIPVYKIDKDIFSALCDTKTPQGIIAVIKMQDFILPNYEGRFVYCDRISDPGNLGTIIRTADAAGFSVLLSPGCAELYSPKTVRSSMGSFFKTRVFCDIEYTTLKNSGLQLIAGALCKDSRDFRSISYSKNCAVIVGNEANGISDELLRLCDEKVIIPIYGGAESLNAAVAAALLMYEAIR